MIEVKTFNFNSRVLTKYDIYLGVMATLVHSTQFTIIRGSKETAAVQLLHVKHFNELKCFT